MAGVGKPKTGGRVKGTPNKATLPLEKKAKELGVDPFEILLLFAKGDWQGLGYDKETRLRWTSAGIEYEEDIIQPEHRLNAAKEACQYIHAKRKAIEHSGEIDTNPYSQMTIGELETEVKKRLKKK